MTSNSCRCLGGSRRAEAHPDAGGGRPGHDPQGVGGGFHGARRFFPLLVAVLTSVSPRLFSLDEEILEFARAQAAGARAGELRGVLPVLAHAEIAVSRLASFPEAESFRAFTDPYFGWYPVQEEILHCARIYFDYKIDVEAWKQLDVRALNFFLFALRLSRMGFAELVEALEGRYTELPWGWLGDSREVFERFTGILPPGDKWAREVWQGDMSSLGLIAVGLVLLYFMLPEALLSAKAARSVVSEGGFLGGPVLVHTAWVDLTVGLALSVVLLLFGGWLLMAQVTRGIARAR